MRWEDESYVRFYRRSTAEWLALSWQARGLVGLIMRELDRAGLLVLGSKLGLKGVASVLRAPWVEIEGPLNELLVDGCFRWDEARGVLWMPNFIEAQEANQSDAQRKRESRARARDAMKAPAIIPERSRNVTPTGNPVTKRDASANGQNHETTQSVDVTTRDASVSRNVTDSEDPVTRGHTRSLCAVPSVPSLLVGTRARVADDVPTTGASLSEEERTMLEEADRAARARGQNASPSSSIAGPTNFFESIEGKEPKT